MDNPIKSRVPARKLTRRTLLAATLVAVSGSPWRGGSDFAQESFDLTHARWDRLVQRFVRVLPQGSQTQVDYAGLQLQRASLLDYLEELAMVSQERFDAWPEADRLAFLINAYNAWTVELILGAYPDLASIRDLGSLFRSPWSRRFVDLFGRQVSLDYIEHDLIRGRRGFAEPRIHFAVNCASIGCPALRNEAWTGERLEAQLEDATVKFLSDRSRTRLEGDTLWVSELFDWYEEDFQQGWRGTRTLGQFLARYADALEIPGQLQTALARGQLRIRYLDYDWGLNDLQPRVAKF